MLGHDLLYQCTMGYIVEVTYSKLGYVCMTDIGLEGVWYATIYDFVGGTRFAERIDRLV